MFETLTWVEGVYIGANPKRMHHDDAIELIIDWPDYVNGPGYCAKFSTTPEELKKMFVEDKVENRMCIWPLGANRFLIYGWAIKRDYEF